MGAKVTGDWEKALRKMEQLPIDLMDGMRKATLQNCVGLTGKIQEGIISQSPGGVAWAPLHPFTIAQRVSGFSSSHQARIEASGGSAKALLNHGDLYGSITYALSDDKLSGRVGVNRKAVNRDGQPIVNIAIVLTEGRIINVTPKMRAWFHWRGFHLKPTTTTIVIPPRPFILPVYRAYLPVMRNRYVVAAGAAVFKGGF